MGDTPSLLYVMHGDPNNPMGESWRGSFEPLSRSARTVFHRPTTANDTVPIYSIIEFHVKGPVCNDIAPDSVCMTLTIGKQDWEGFYLGEGDYVVRHSTYYLGTLPYTIVSPIPGFPKQEGEITIANNWPGTPCDTDYPLGDSCLRIKKMLPSIAIICKEPKPSTNGGMKLWKTGDSD